MDREDQVFEGHITIHNGNENYTRLLAVALQNTKNIGYKRNRGFGRIQCTMDGQEDLVNRALGME